MIKTWKLKCFELWVEFNLLRIENGFLSKNTIAELTLTYENEETENMDSKRKVKNLFAEYARASSLHGLSYIGETKRHWIEKYASINMFLESTWHLFKNLKKYCFIIS